MDGDWVLREDDEALRRVLELLSPRGARYRLRRAMRAGLAGGWSSRSGRARTS